MMVTLKILWKLFSNSYCSWNNDE